MSEDKFPPRIWQHLMKNGSVEQERTRYISEQEHAVIVAKLEAEVEKLRLALSMYSSERMRLGSTVTPKWADDALKAREPGEEKK